MPLWGQFLDHTGQIKVSMTRPFLECLERQSSLDGLGRCFQFQVLTVEASVREFHDLYGTQAQGVGTSRPGARPAATVCGFGLGLTRVEGETA